MAIKEETILQRVWRGILDSLISEDDTAYSLVPKNPVQVERSTSMARLREQLWRALEDVSDEWSYPIDVFVDDDGKSLFAIVAQSGKLYQVPLTVSQDELTLGDWVQVKEEFTPITQNRFSVRRQKDGTYRWLCIAGTTVLNRVGEIDSSDLFDSFVERAEKTGKYPRVDFYHLGELNPKAWEFGTADYLAREGVCYIASGTFDNDHPLARATIKACEDNPDLWGNSIEFYAYSEPEIILADPEVRIPVYKDGENTRISVVLEEDAAGLFTRIGVNEEVKRAMDAKTKEVLGTLFGDDTDGLQSFIDSFEENVDGVNQRVKNDKLIHRAKTTGATSGEDTSDEDGDDDEEDEDEDGDTPELVLDEAAVAVITQQMLESDGFKSVIQSLDDIKKLVGEMAVAREKDSQEIAKLKKDNGKISQTIQQLNKEDVEKQSEWLQDLPTRKQVRVTHRPRDVHNTENDEDDEDSNEIAERVLSGIKLAY